MIDIQNLHVHYSSEQGTVHAVRGVDLHVAPGQFFTMLGPSGCGKTTTLRCLAGLERPTEGEIAIDGDAVFSARTGTVLPSHKRDIGMVFQSYAIWPHMTVFENAAFPLHEARPRVPRADIRQRVAKALAMVQLEGLENRPAPFLSGGQQQRLALARALVREPKVLLLDEPLSNLDAKLREETRVELRELVKRLGITTVYVTHDQLEALTMSDVVAVMEEGRIVQSAPPAELYRNPGNRFVAGFVGQSNFLEGEVIAAQSAAAPGRVDTAFGAIACALPAGAGPGSRVTVVIRPEDIELSADSDGRDNTLEGQVAVVLFLGDSLECQLRKGDDRVRFRVHPTVDVREGQTVRLATTAETCRALA